MILCDSVRLRLVLFGCLDISGWNSVLCSVGGILVLLLIMFICSVLCSICLLRCMLCLVCVCRVSVCVLVLCVFCVRFSSICSRWLVLVGKFGRLGL